MFKVNNKDTRTTPKFNILCKCNLEPELRLHFLLPWHLFEARRRTFPDEIKDIDANIINVNNNYLDSILKGCVRYIFASLFCISKSEHY